MPLYITVYPNPAVREVTVSGMESGATVSIIDVNGREIHHAEKVAGAYSLNLGTMARGTYFVRVTDRRGVTVRKLVVK